MAETRRSATNVAAAMIVEYLKSRVAKSDLAPGSA
jgi:hypothetical protein